MGKFEEEIRETGKVAALANDRVLIVIEQDNGSFNLTLEATYANLDSIHRVLARNAIAFDQLVFAPVGEDNE